MPTLADTAKAIRATKPLLRVLGPVMNNESQIERLSRSPRATRLITRPEVAAEVLFQNRPGSQTEQMQKQVGRQRPHRFGCGSFWNASNPRPGCAPGAAERRVYRARSSSTRVAGRV